MEIIALVLAGGNGDRFNTEIPKQYIEDLGILNKSIKAFAINKRIDKIQVVIGKDHTNFYKPSNEEKLLPVVFGGRRRQDSVCNGLKALEKYNPKFVLIHDGVRPFVSQELINEIINELSSNIGVVPTINLTDALLKVSDKGNVEKYIKKDSVRRIQTPQGFSFAGINRCHKLEEESSYTFSDDTELLHKYNIPIVTIPGEKNNVKVTYQEDV